MKIIVIQSKKTQRVPIMPDEVSKLLKMNYEIYIQSEIGEHIFISDSEYIKNGAKIFKNISELNNNFDIVLSVHFDSFLLDLIDSNCLSNKIFIFSTKNSDIPNDSNNIFFNLENLPRITKAQSMDVLSSQNNIAGYRAVIESANISEKILPMMTTAASNIKPAKVLVIGAGVSGLQSIATAKRLGANVFGCDVRIESKTEIESLGGNFVQIPIVASVKSGYVTDFSEDSLTKQQSILEEHIITSDIIICSALVRGKKAPLIIKKDIVKKMKKGSVVIDLAIASGGNCELSAQGIVYENGVKIVGYENICENVPIESSKMLSKNYFNFIQYLLNTKFLSSLENLKDFQNIPDYLNSDTMKSVSSDEIISSTIENYRI